LLCWISCRKKMRITFPFRFSCFFTHPCC
jgi:hypothetical protein